MDLLTHLQDFVSANKLFEKGQRGMLAVSGGIDSMVMLDLFGKAGYSFAVAHCNFQLRQAESEADELLVRDKAKHWGVPFFVIRFETVAEATRRQVSIQMAARELRYEWFEQLVEQEGFDYVATAHHLNDSLETLLLHLVKGTGIAGLKSIPMKRGVFVRPMLFASKADIEDYALQQKVAWREDASNASDKYQRNWLRHKVVPLLKKINPSLEDTFRDTQRRLLGLEAVFSQSIGETREKVMKKKAGGWGIAVPELLQLTDPLVQLYYLIEPFGFSFRQAKEIFHTLDGQAGGIFYSNRYKLLRDRHQLLIQEKRKGPLNKTEYQVGEVDAWGGHALTTDGGTFTFAPSAGEALQQLPIDPAVALLDMGKIVFPLKIRRWKRGDHFRPLGMKQHKKLSDFFADLKLNRFEKEKVWILENGNGDILWVVGHRIDDRVKIVKETQKALLVTYKS